jgi:AAA15 family ATPase/GTPase
MNNHFIKNIEIKNFKCFEDFNAEGFGRVNLIGGKNNVGKTAFIEACLVNVYAQNFNSFITSLHSIKFRREILKGTSNNPIGS